MGLHEKRRIEVRSATRARYWGQGLIAGFAYNRNRWLPRLSPDMWAPEKTIRCVPSIPNQFGRNVARATAVATRESSAAAAANQQDHLADSQALNIIFASRTIRMFESVAMSESGHM